MNLIEAIGVVISAMCVVAAGSAVIYHVCWMRRFHKQVQATLDRPEQER